MPLDYNILNKGVSLLDNQRLQQDFDLKKQAAMQALTTGSLDQATKQNALKYQLIAAGSANGADGLSAAKNKLGQLGIDTSEYSDDPAQAAQQALAAQQATSPYGTLFNAQQKVIGNNIAATGAFGDINNPYAQPVPNLPINIRPATQPAPQQSPQPVTLTPPQDGSSLAIPQVNEYIDAPPPLPNTQLNRGSKIPPQQFGETLTAYKERLSNDPSVIQVKKEAEVTGDLNAKNIEAAKKADELTKRLEMNLQAMKDLNTSVPSSGFVPQGAKVYMSQALGANGLGDGSAASASHQFDKINNDQILSDIQQFVATGGANTRINQTLEKIVQAASGVDKTASPEARAAMLDAALAEIKNKNTTVQNIVGGNDEYQKIPVVTNPIQQSFNAKKYSNPDAIKSAYQSGKLTKDQATALLKAQHGFND